MTELDTDVSVTINEIDIAISEKEDILREIKNMEYSIENKKNKLEELDKKISNLCDHKFVNDFIDTTNINSSDIADELTSLGLECNIIKKLHTYIVHLWCLLSTV